MVALQMSAAGALLAGAEQELWAIGRALGLPMLVSNTATLPMPTGLGIRAAATARRRRCG